MSIKRIEAGRYTVSDGRLIIKEGSNWYVLNSEGNIELGELPTLASAKEYISNGVTTLGHHNTSVTSYSKQQRKKEFNTYLASEAKNGNYIPVILWFIIMLIVALIFAAVKQ